MKILITGAAGFIGSNLVKAVFGQMPEAACGLNIPAGQWPTLRTLESGTVILKIKEGAYEPISHADILS